MINHKGNGVGSVGFRNDGCGMVGKNHNFIVFAAVVEIVKNDGKNSLVNEFNCSDFVFGFVSVTAFVGSFDMDINKVFAVFPFVIIASAFCHQTLHPGLQSLGR